jgi:hypothetical protein
VARLETTALAGIGATGQSLARMISPTIDVREPFRELAAKPPRAVLLRGGKGRLDAGLALAYLEEESRDRCRA